MGRMEEVRGGAWVLWKTGDLIQFVGNGCLTVGLV